MKIWISKWSDLREDGTQTFAGTTMTGYFWAAKFTKHLLIMTFKGQDDTFIAQEGWDTNEKKRRELIEEIFSVK